MIQVLKQFSFNFQARMSKQKSRGGAASGRRAGSRQTARTDADEAMEDALAEINDVSAALRTPSAAAGESASQPEHPALPEALLQRRLAKEKSENLKEPAIKEKELLQKKWMRCKPSWIWLMQRLVTSCQLTVPLLLLPARYA